MPFFRAGCAGYFLLLAQEKVTKEKGTPTAGFQRGQTREAALTPLKLPCAPRPFARSPNSQFARRVGCAAAPLEQLKQEARFIAKGLRCSAAPTGEGKSKPGTPAPGFAFVQLGVGLLHYLGDSADSAYHPIVRHPSNKLLSTLGGKIMRIYVLLLAFASVVANAEQSTDSTGDYHMDLGQVYGASQSMKQYRDICTSAFPQLRAENEAAYSGWRAKYLAFLQEVEKHWTALAWKEAGGDAKKHAVVLQKMSTMFEQSKSALEGELRDGGNEQFKLKCTLYPKYLGADRGNLEYFYAEQVATIRRGP